MHLLPILKESEITIMPPTVTIPFVEEKFSGLDLEMYENKNCDYDGYNITVIRVGK